jgi:hypothetical protein
MKHFKKDLVWECEKLHVTDSGDEGEWSITGICIFWPRTALPKALYEEV